MLAGENSILSQAGRARDLKGQKDIEERIQLAYMAAISNGLGDTTNGKFEEELKNEFGKDNVIDLADDLSKVKINGKEYETGVSGGVDTIAKIADKKPISGEKITALSDKDTMPLKDDLGNIVKVPKGFGIAEDSGTKVEEGIVIEDADSTRQTYKSQFVWIPVGTGIKVSTEISASGTINIPLGRYVFNTYTGAEIEYLGNDVNSTEDTQLSHNTNYSNTIAKDIERFKSSANTNQGYYIARYEAGIDANTDQYEYANCAGSGPSLTYGDSNKMFKKNGDIKPLSIKGKGVWNAVTQGEAATISRCMYNTTTDMVTSDLINSYAWDTAIVFIQKCRK